MYRLNGRCNGLMKQSYIRRGIHTISFNKNDVYWFTDIIINMYLKKKIFLDFRCIGEPKETETQTVLNYLFYAFVKSVSAYVVNSAFGDDEFKILWSKV